MIGKMMKIMTSAYGLGCLVSISTMMRKAMSPELNRAITAPVRDKGL
jgi:hypothetical protein